MNRSTKVAIKLAIVTIILGILVISCLPKVEAQDTCTITIAAESTSSELKFLVSGDREHIGLELDLGWRTMKILVPVVDGQAVLRQLEPFSFRFTAEETVCGQSGWFISNGWYRWTPIQARVRGCTFELTHYCDEQHVVTVLAESNTYDIEWSTSCAEGSTTTYKGSIGTCSGNVIAIKNGDYIFRLWESLGYGQGLGKMLYEVTVHVDGCNVVAIPLVF